MCLLIHICKSVLLLQLVSSNRRVNWSCTYGCQLKLSLILPMTFNFRYKQAIQNASKLVLIGRQWTLTEGNAGTECQFVWKGVKDMVAL